MAEKGVITQWVVVGRCVDVIAAVESGVRKWGGHAKVLRCDCAADLYFGAMSLDSMSGLIEVRKR